MKNIRSFFGLIALFVSLTACNGDNENFGIYSSIDHATADFAIDEIIQAGSQEELIFQRTEGDLADVIIELDSQDESIEAEGFRLIRDGKRIRVIAADEAGAMYGGLELAEQIRLFGWEGIQETTQNPYMELRGTKFNIPLDVRTPTYTDPCDAAQINMPEMWNLDFWKEYIDNLARYRYNFISLWSLHPFPSMVKVPGYEDIALDDVLRSTAEWKEYYSVMGVGFDDPDILANPEMIKEMTIDEKIKFWQEVMAYGKSRNVDFFMVTWNIFVYGTDGKHGITDDIDNPTTRDYFRKSVKQMFLTYPDLDGIGLTTGENMQESTFEEKEDWAFDTYARGVLDAAEEMPEREFTFIHRQHMTGAKDIARKFQPVIEKNNIEFLFSFKYAKAHVFSATEQPYHTQFVKDIEGMKTIWTLRNDDNYYFRWGAPDFVREFISNIPYDVSRGFYYGSDQWVWGREFLMKEPETPRQLEIVKHWYHWMIWGRLGYDPGLGNERFIHIIQDHFPGANAELLFTAWQEASMIYPTTTGFHWGPIDLRWYIEGCRSIPLTTENDYGFHDVNKFISLPPHVLSGNQSIPDFVKSTVEGSTSDLPSPLEVARLLHGYADRTFEMLGELDAVGNKELEVTLHDIRTMAMLGKYYASKIAGSAYVALYRETRHSDYQEKAVSELSDALEFWKEFTTLGLEQNKNPLWTNRVGHVDWVKTTEWVERDIAIARMDEW